MKVASFAATQYVARMGRPKTDQPRSHRHFTTLTDAEQCAWTATLASDFWGPLGRPRDGDAVRLAMGRLASAAGVAWPLSDSTAVSPPLKKRKT